MHRFKSISKTRLDQIQNRKDVLLADVRTPEYFRSGSLEGAKNLYPTRNFVNQLHTLKNKNQPIVIISHDTNDEEVVASANYAEQLGFQNVYVSDIVSLRD